MVFSTEQRLACGIVLLPDGISRGVTSGQPPWGRSRRRRIASAWAEGRPGRAPFDTEGRGCERARTSFVPLPRTTMPTLLRATIAAVLAAAAGAQSFVNFENGPVHP